MGQWGLKEGWILLVGSIESERIACYHGTSTFNTQLVSSTVRQKEIRKDDNKAR